MALPAGRERDKMSARELREAIEDAKKATETPVANPPVPPTVAQTEAPGVSKEQATPAATQPVTPGVVTEPVKKEEATAPKAQDKAVKPEVTYEELAKKAGYKSPDDMAKSLVELRRKFDREMQLKSQKEREAVSTPPNTPTPQMTSQYGFGQGTLDTELQDPDMPVSAKQLKDLERRMLENTIIAAKMMAEKEVQPLKEKTQREIEDAEIKNLALSDPLYCTSEAQSEIDKVIAENPWIKDVPSRQTVAWKIARGNLMSTNQLPAIETRQVTQPGQSQSPAQNTGYVESSGAASTMTPTSMIDTNNKTAREIRDELKKKGVKIIPGANVYE